MDSADEDTKGRCNCVYIRTCAETYVSHESRTKAESPQHLAKVKRTDNASSASSRNASPPPAQRKKKASKNVRISDNCNLSDCAKR